MIATTDQKARLLDLTTGVLELVRDGGRDIEEVSLLLQMVKDEPAFAAHFLRGEERQGEPRSWREEDGVIYFSVTSDGTTGEDWITRFESKGSRVGDYAKRRLRLPDFKPTSGVKTKVAVLKGMLFENNDRITRNICAEAHRRKLSKPNPEVACLIREKFTDEEIEVMGLWQIVVMHDSVGDPISLYADRSVGGRWLHACHIGPGGRWNRGSGFAFAVSKI